MYHAGNLADVHKHGLLSWILAYLTAKDKPLCYIETHAGRGLYDLDDHAALKTGEAAQGIDRVANFFPPAHPYSLVLRAQRDISGPRAYPGSPLIATQLLRSGDTLHLAELHPGEFAALEYATSATKARCYHRDGFELAHSLVPPTPRRGMIMIDPSYEQKSDYAEIPGHISRITRAWNVGLVVLWYPVLTSGAQAGMVRTLKNNRPEAFCHEVSFPPARPGHGMVGSGLFVINPPWGLADEAARLSACFAKLQNPREKD